MPHYLIQVAYNESALQALVKNPQDRIEAVRPAVENLGGKIKEGISHSATMTPCSLRKCPIT